MDQRNLLSFVQKMKLNVDKNIWNVGCVTGLRKAEKMSITMLVLIARVRQQPMKTLKQWRITIREVADDIGLSFGLCQAIFTDALGMKHATAKIVTKLRRLLQLSKNNVAYTSLLTTFNDDPDLFKKVITGGESWVYGYNIETKV